ncbi:MAG TPA: amidohydrolase family protein [Thermoplasmata archaeon]|nr:amidohydrolase family protein [Thermoplasmata archaeon]
MDVTDCHVHINPIWEMRPDALQLIGHIDPQVARLVHEPRLFLDMLDRSGVERAVLVNYVAPEVIGYTEKANAFVSEYARADPDRLIAVGGISPDHPKPAEEIRHLVDALGIRALKLHPPHQLFRPNDYAEGRHPGLSEIYAACARHTLPVIFHTGTSIFPRARSRFGDPLLLEDVALDYPELTIVLAHGGRPFWTEEAVYLARRFPNVWLEISGVPPTRLLEYFPILPRISDKVLFGSDWPGPGVKGIGENLEQFRALGLPEDAQRRILEENPRRVFRPR